MTSIKLFVIALLVFLVSDAVWLGYVSKALYIQHYQPWLRLENGELQPLWWSAALVYILLALAISVFVVPLSSSLLSALLYGALMGAIIYGVYDFTCLAIYKDFPVGMAFVDWAWGAFASALSAAVTVYCARFL